MSKKKTVKAPLTYDPGKGRPKEHLAYLNWQEMEALKSLNGKNVERGPKGIPSYAAFAGTTGTGYASAARSTPASSKTSGSSSISRISGGTAGSNTARASAASRTTTTSRTSGVQTSAPRSISGIGSPSRGVTASYSRGVTTPSAQRTASSVGSPVDRAVKQAVESRSISSAQKTPALRQDKAKASGGYKLSDITGTNVPGGKVTGAIQSVKDLGIAGVPGTSRIGVPSATVTTQQMKNLYSQYQQPPSPPPTTQQIAERLRQVYPDRWGKYSVSEVASVVDAMGQAYPGEADINKNSAASMRNLAQVGINQVLRNISPEDMLKGIDTTGMDTKRGTQAFAMPGPKSMGMTRNWENQKLAQQSYETALRAIESAVENKGVSPQARNATNFVAAGTPMVKNVRSVGSPVYNTQFGVDPTGKRAVEKRNRLADLKKDYAQYRTPPSDMRIVLVSSTPERTSVPGLISYPDLNRPIPPSAGRSAVVPTVRAKKQITDRLLAEPAYRPYDIRVNAPPAPPIRRKEIYDRILPEQAPVSPKGIKEFYDRVPASVPSGTETSFGGPTERIIPTGDTLTRSLSGVGENAPIPRLRPAVQGPPRPTGGMSFRPNLPTSIGVDASASGISGVNASFDKASPPIVGMGARAYGMPGVNAEFDRNIQLSDMGVRGGLDGKAGVLASGRGALAASSPEMERFNALQAEFDAANKRISAQQGAGAAALRGDVESALTVGEDTKKTLDMANYVIGALNTGIGSKKKSLSDSSKVAATKLVDKFASNLYGQYAPEVNKSAFDKVKSGVGALVNMVNLGVKAGTNLEGSLEGAKTVKAAEGDKLPRTSTINAPAVESIPPAIGNRKVNVEGIGNTTIADAVETYDLTPAQKVEAARKINEIAGRGTISDTEFGDIMTNLSTSGEITSEKEAATYPKYVDQKTQKEMNRQETVNKIGVGIIKSRNPLLSLVDVTKKAFTGEGIADSSAALKRQYLQSSEQQQAELERRYPNLTKFANDVGVGSQLPMSNYVSWAEKSGLRGPASVSRDSGIAALAGVPASGVVAPTSSTPSASSRERPEIYYMWDLGVNIPSPSDPNYTQYQTYLIDRAASQRAMGWA